MIEPYVLVILALAVARLCVLMVTDEITKFFREAVKTKFGPEHLLTIGAHCPWCWSIWFAFPMTALTAWTTNAQGPIWLHILSALAVSWVASYLADR